MLAAPSELCDLCFVKVFETEAVDMCRLDILLVLCCAKRVDFFASASPLFPLM